MNQVNPYASAGRSNDFGVPAAFAQESDRAAFIRSTYTHLTLAIFAFMALEVALFAMVPRETMTNLVRSMTGGYSWLLVLGAFIGVGWVARSWASSGGSRAKQYAGLGLYVVAEALIVMPLLYFAVIVSGQPQIPVYAGIITCITFAGLTGFVMLTRVDLASWGTYLFVAGWVLFAMVIAAVLFGFSLGVFFSGGVVALACGYILYDTSNVLHHYRTDQSVAASLALFASVALLFYYVVRLLLAFSSND